MDFVFSFFDQSSTPPACFVQNVLFFLLYHLRCCTEARANTTVASVPINRLSKAALTIPGVGDRVRETHSTDEKHRLGTRLVRIRFCVSSFLRAVHWAVGAVLSLLVVLGVRRDSADKRKQVQSASTMRTVKPLDASVAAAHPDNTVINSRYTYYNFVFLNLYEQFRRPLNFYFLLVVFLQFISVIAPVSPLSTLLPLLLAFSLTALKEGYDDVKRHRQDAVYNNTTRTILNPETASWEKRRNCRIRVGDVILLQNDEEIPCDVVVVAAVSHTVYIRTDNLDGELDLKPREIVMPHNTSFLSEYDVEAMAAADAGNANIIHINDNCDVLMEKLALLKFTCPPPSAMLDSFDGRAEFQHPTSSGPPTYVSLSHHHLLPQSCRLKNTQSVICVAVYTGDETKCGMNKRPPPVKWAKIDQDVSRYSVIVFCCQLANAFAFGIAGYLMNRDIEERFWYLQMPPSESNASFIIYPLRFFLLTTVMIPVSFKFVVDMSKYYMAMTVEWDEVMKHGGPDSEGCRVKNSSILEDLGQIDYVLSDKTGTMTQNVMELLYVTIGEERIPLHLDKEDSSENKQAIVPSDDRVLHFGRVLSLCNAVEVVERPCDPHGAVNMEPFLYQAASPDEEALCRGSAQLHVRLVRRDAHEIVLDVKGVRETWILHHTFPFSSELKSMGVIVEEKSTGIIYYFVKGADDRIVEMTSAASPLSSSVSLKMRESQQESLVSHLDAYAMKGLRTLVVAEKQLGKADLHAFLNQVKAAELSLHGRREQMQEIRLKMETGVCITGITAIEDKLQEAVHDTVRDFLRAGIKVWMLTGDKVQTAEQISLSCGLYSAGNRVLRVVSASTDSEATWEDRMMALPLPMSRGATANRLEGVPLSMGAEILNAEVLYDVDTQGNASCLSNVFRNEIGGYNTMLSAATVNSQCVLVVEGGVVLERILKTPALRERFAALSDACVSVICARVTPSQKAAVTNFVRSRGFMTLAVGDGGNDVAMLQEAHVGVGITGKEGQQAARAADFVITRFSDLRALVFVHGQQAYTRTAYVIKYSFYKSMLISFIQLAYNVVGTHVSGGTFWNSFSLTLWNGVYTLPQTLFYCLDRITPRNVLERHTFLYKMTRRATDMNIREFFVVFVFRGIVQSVATLWLLLGVFGTSFAFEGNGRTASNDVVFSVAYSALILSQMLTLLLESHTITFLNAFWIFGMPLLYVAATSAYSSIPKFQYFGVWTNSISVASFLTVFGVAFMLVLPVLGLLTLRQALNPDPRDILRSAAIKSQNRRQVSYGYGRCMSRLCRFLLCVPEEASCFIETPLSARRLDDLC
ncbi:phospholipid-translocating P-type ATPase (flippase) [Trypanosoma grayi]|uniref:phospholipid-translocating P-type ATPase (flippase) n=1 Tax=Trypanosoma grayi TaxID=71804 RepID=UPI0004F42E6C|nr:phospholipid-translocating P-type ATPase (flippase) [Trypanosoma grayi]KEG15608.1 phospholipid-translocating P-type ATPase (flippase) [Trypanosoma grayi]